MTEQFRLRLAARREAVERHERQFRTLGYLRLLTVVAGAGLAWVQIWTLPLAVSAFLALLIWHERIARSAALEKRAIAFYQRGLARLEGTWTTSGETGARFASPQHPYSGDLDIFGPGSMFHRINMARTVAGEEVLAQWLQFPASPEEVARRQEAIRELIPRLDLREDLALLGEDVRSGLHAPALLRWGDAPAEAATPAHRLLAAGMSLGLLVSFSGFMFQFWGKGPVLLFVLGELGLFTIMRARLARILGSVEMPARDLGVLAGLIGRVESEQFTSPLLRDLIARICTEGQPASRQIARLRRLIEFRDQARNQMFAIAAEPLLWSMHFGFAIERWRQVSGRHLGDWLAAMGEVEALASIAGYAAERPDCIFPELASDGPVLDAEAIAHPLLGDEAVSNDVRLDASLRLLLISGSNMSGKSTLLRAVGSQHRAGVGRGAGSSPAAARFRAHGRRVHAGPGQFDGRRVSFLRRNHPAPPNRRPRRKGPHTAVPARRIAQRHQLARPPAGLRSRRKNTGAARSHRNGDHPRSGAGPHRRGTGAPGRQRPFRGSH
ncbi:MAG: hypothetical protein SGI92_13675 [Bryobacteraceae bacterium]|nr:hypothetical protein [Bryobacteraceae bacterium]